MPCPTYRISILGRAQGSPSAVGAAAYGSGKVLRVSSALAAASYLSGEPLRDHQLEQTFSYSSRDDVRHTEILTPQRAPAWAKHRETLWNEVEKKESRVNSQLARSIIIALPRELSLEQNIALLREHLQEQFVSKGMVADFAVHEIPAADGGNQPHAHVLLTTRGFNVDGTWEKTKNRDWNGYNEAKEWDAKGNPIAANRRFESAEPWRDSWEKTQNAHLEKANSDARISMKSYKEQGIDKTPQMHLGPNLADMERAGKQTDKGNYNRAATERNFWVAQRMKVVEAVKGWMRYFTKPDKAKEQRREYTAEDIKAYYARMEARVGRVDEPPLEDLKKAERQQQEQKQEQAKAQRKKEAQQGAAGSSKPEADKRPRRVASPEDREHYKALRPFLQNHSWDSRQDKMHFIAVTSNYLHQRKAEARRDVFERLAGMRDTQRFRAVWQDRPVPGQGRERNRGGRER